MSANRVLQLSSNLGIFGAEAVVLELCKAMKKFQGYTPVLGVFKNSRNPHTELAEESDRLGIETSVFDCNGRLDGKAISELRNYICRNDIAVVHSHGYKTDYYAWMATKSLGIPRVATCHPWIEVGSIMKTYARLDRFILKRFDQLVAVSGIVMQKLLACHFPSSRIQIIYNGVDTKIFEKSLNGSISKKHFGISPEKIVLGTVGRLVPEKGHRFLIDAFVEVIREFPGLQLLIVGEGELNGTLKKQAEATGVHDKVIFTGLSRDIPGMLSLMDIFVFPSLSEGFPMAILEAMAAGKAIIASDVGEIPKLIKNDQNGLLISSGNSYSLVEAIFKLLRNPEKTKHFGRQAKLDVNRKYTSEVMAESYKNIYDRVLQVVPTE